MLRPRKGHVEVSFHDTDGISQIRRGSGWEQDVRDRRVDVAVHVFTEGWGLRRGEGHVAGDEVGDEGRMDGDQRGVRGQAVCDIGARRLSDEGVRSG